MPQDWSDTILISEPSDEPQLSEEIAGVFQAVAQNATRGSKHVVINFSSVTYMTSSHLAQMLRLRKKLADQGRTLILCSMNDHLWSVMLLTGLDRVFRYVPDPTTALATLQLEDGAAR